MFAYVAVFIVGLLYAYAAAPKNKNQKIEQDSFEAPTAEEGKVIPVLFGTRDIKSPNIIWYGDVSTTPVKKRGGKKG